ncbi:MAG TPA: rhomboid family intramembrane serine protease [Gammaproteobacteria bacterium]|nr:rhomboid family intramembrane serine protease [Gammaproteobacteria bacterium]
MFIPLDRKLDWRNPPVLTVLLILVNVFVYYAWQTHDTEYQNEAFTYYFDSRLPEIELPRYVTYLRENGQAQEATRLAGRLKHGGQRGQAAVFMHMLGDGPFLDRLHHDQVIRPGDADYQEWRWARSRFDEQLNRSVAYRWGQKPYEFSVLTLFTQMFLHGGQAHLIGNMIFLFIFGFVVEIAIGRPVFLFAYLLAGLFSGALDLAFRPDSMIPAIGASGAIAGLVGMYTVLFGLRRIWFFFMLGFYFDYVRAPAIVLLPLWLGYELFYQLFAPNEVNRIAHIGGLLGGALIGYLAKRYSPTVDHDYIDEGVRQEKRKQDYQRGLEHMAAMELDEAKAVFEDLGAANPNDRNVLLQLYNIAKVNPAGQDYHTLAHRIFSLPGQDVATLKLINDTYGEYIQKAKPGPRFNPDQLMTLAIRFAAAGYLDDAEKMVLHVLQKQQGFGRNAEGLMALANGFRRGDQPQMYRKYLSVLLDRFPHSPEAEHVRRAIDAAPPPAETPGSA